LLTGGRYADLSVQMQRLWQDKRVSGELLQQTEQILCALWKQGVAETVFYVRSSNQGGRLKALLRMQ
jgi:hypothetical protein